MSSVFLRNVGGLAPFDCSDTAGISARWERWLRAFELFADGKGVKHADQKKSLMLHTAGLNVQDIFFTLDQGTGENNYLKVIGGKDIFLRISTSGECDKKDYVWETLQSELAKVFANTQNYIGAELIADIRCGSLTFDVSLKYNTRVAEDVIISTIRNAILHDKLGELRIDVSSIIGIAPVPLPTATQPLKTTPKPESDDTWDIVGAVLGAVAFVVIVAVIIWCVRRKKYCSKETKEFSSTNVSGQGRGHGAQGQNGDDESHGSTSVLRPSNMPRNRDKEDAGQAMALHVYAEVDKSNKKPRAETGGARQSGEMQYLQIDHSNNEGSLPRKSSSEPMIAPSYQETVYADLV